jgi:hypothetical protein
MTGARAVWTEGSQWRVIREGARLSGMVSGGPGWMRGWGRPLVVGEVVTCVGFKMGWGSDSIPEAMFSTPDSIEARASFVNINPQVGMWQPYPQDGYLERVE